MKPDSDERLTMGAMRARTATRQAEIRRKAARVDKIVGWAIGFVIALSVMWLILLMWATIALVRYVTG